MLDPADPAGIFGESYNQCLEQIKQQYVTATAIGSMVACLLMGLVANLPIALAPGMGMNAYFVSLSLLIFSLNFQSQNIRANFSFISFLSIDI